jgi:hypothetical protein
LGARDHAERAPATAIPRILNSIGVTLRNERESITICDPVDDSVYHKIIRFTDVRPENDNRSDRRWTCNYGRGVLATYYDQRTNRQHAIGWRTHASGGDNQYRILSIENQTNSTPYGESP